MAHLANGLSLDCTSETRRTSRLCVLGVSIGLCVMSVISGSVEAGNKSEGMEEALLHSYRASFWTQFAWILASCAIGAVGLRKLGRVGMKRD